MHKLRKKLWPEARDAFIEAYRRAPNETSYALLATVNWLRIGRSNESRQFLEQAIRGVRRETMDWYILRLFYDFAGDNDVAVRIDRERNPDIKARTLFYLAQYYDIRGNRILADKYFMQVRELNRRGIPEWRLNEWTVTERNLNVF
ncbi:MAG: hypothetical protein LBP32_05060 [Spirochaetaceae bacterium]|jgi:tetratricopeptide (TPR) repeat protein|nr:hypothetical protein [Spirochaetaceae bacterium]